MSDSPEDDWIHCQEVKSGKYFWLHSTTHEISNTEPSEINGNESISISRRNTINLDTNDNSTPPSNTNNNNNNYENENENENDNNNMFELTFTPPAPPKKPD
eukprot:64239_1